MSRLRPGAKRPLAAEAEAEAEARAGDGDGDGVVPLDVLD